MSQNQTFKQELLLFSVKVLLLKTYSICRKKWCNFIKKIISTKGIKRWLLLIALGLCNCIATTPFSVIIVLPLTFCSLFYIIDKCKNEKIKSQLAIIFFFLLGHFISIFWWMFVPLTTELSQFFWLIPFAVIGVPFATATLFISFFFIGVIIWNKLYKNKNYNMLYFACIFCICWLLADYVRGHFIFGGFPWMLFGHFVIYPFAIQAIRFIGVDLFSICFLALVLVPYFWIFKKSMLSRQICFAIICGWVANCVIGFLCINILKPKHINLNIIGSQLNVEPTIKYSPYIESTTLEKRLKQISFASITSRPTLLLLPEAVISQTLHTGDNITEVMGTIIPNDKSLMLFGGVYFEGATPYNVIYSITKYGDVVSLYRKQKLVPFGEYIPFKKHFPFLIHSITGGMIDFGIGTHNNYYTMYRDMPILYPIVCYESIFPEVVKKNIEKSRKQISSLSNEYRENNKIKPINERGEMIVNLTNDAWMKWSIGTYQHYLMAKFLAVATNLPVVRLSNNGKSAYIDNFGVAHNETKMNKEDILFVKNYK